MILRTKTLWENGIGNAWLRTNVHDLGKEDIVSDALAALDIKAESTVLEVGCSNGWRLKKIQEKYGCTVCGVDPSADAIKAAVESGLDSTTVVRGTADDIRAPDNAFDIVIIGFCLCFIGPEDWVKVVSETARVLKEGGHLIINDFAGPGRITRYPFQRTMVAGKEIPIYIFIYDWPALWLQFPEFKLVSEIHVRKKTHVVSVLRKSHADIFVGEDVR